MQQIALFLHLLIDVRMSSKHLDLTTEEGIVQGCIRRDQRAQKALYEKFSSRMFAVCLRYSRDREEAEDLLQEGFITLFSKIDMYSGTGSLEGWMRRIFVNSALMKLRKSDVLRNAEDVAEAARSFHAGDDILAGIGGDEILKLISRMPEGFRVVFNMNVIEGYSHKEIAEALGITEGASRSQLSRGRMWLQDKLKKMEKK